MPDPDAHDKNLRAAHEKLMRTDAPSFDVQKILAENCIKQEHQKEASKEALDKLNHELAGARARGNARRIHELEQARLEEQKKQSHDLETMRQSLDHEKADFMATIKPPDHKDPA